MNALVLVDLQKDFLPGGALAVEQGDRVVPIANELAARFPIVVATQDWHPPDHQSFAVSHPGRRPGDEIDLHGLSQVLWPVHCVQGTRDAALHDDLHAPQAQLVIRKGFHREVDSYSAFVEADRRTSTGLAAYLKARGIARLFLCGLATDYCVAWSALDARTEGFEVTVVEDACRAIDLNGSLAKAWADMTAAGVARIDSAALLDA